MKMFNPAKMIYFSPFEEFDLSHEFRPDPNALLHARGGV